MGACVVGHRDCMRTGRRDREMNSSNDNNNLTDESSACDEIALLRSLARGHSRRI